MDAHSPDGAKSRHAYMHRTKSVDYGIILSGEIDMLMDDSEVHLKAGDIIVQQGTNHAWVNKSDKFCRIAFVLIDGHDPLEKALIGPRRTGETRMIVMVNADKAVSLVQADDFKRFHCEIQIPNATLEQAQAALQGHRGTGIARAGVGRCRCAVGAEARFHCAAMGSIGSNHD